MKWPSSMLLYSPNTQFIKFKLHALCNICQGIGSTSIRVHLSNGKSLNHGGNEQNLWFKYLHYDAFECLLHSLED